MGNLKKLISTYENYPKAGVSFKDVIEIVQHPSTFQQLILDCWQTQYQNHELIVLGKLNNVNFL